MIRLSPESVEALPLGSMLPVLMHEGKRTCQVLEIADIGSLSVAEKAKKKKLDCEASETQILVWITVKMAAKARTVPETPDADQPKKYKDACKYLKAAITGKKKLQ